MSKIIDKRIVAIVALLFPAIVGAQGAKELILGVGRLVYILLPLSFGLAILFFIWGLAKFILKADSETERDEGKQVMKWGIVALVVILSFWGLVAIIQGELGVTGENILFGEIF